MGQLEYQESPHAIGEDPLPVINYVYQHGALVGMTATVDQWVQELIPDSASVPGVEYNLAGGIELTRYGNGLETHVEPNAAFLPQQIWVDDAVDDTLFETGVYQYDGARNIKAIGNDEYRYDLVGRLRRAKVFSNDFASGLVLDYQYDRYGNMTDRDTGGYGPVGLDFIGRTYSDNRISNSGFEYDSNGNLIKESARGLGVGGYHYGFTPENRLTLVRGWEDDEIRGKVYQESLYDAGGNRWARVISADGGKGLLTLRDASGQVAVEYEESSATSGLQPKKQYARANGRLVAVHSVCGPAPILDLATAASSPDLTLRKIDDETLVLEGDYTIVIQSESGATNTLTLPMNSPDTFEISAGEFFSGNNWVRIKAHAGCGDTGYSNAISHHRGDGSDCLDAIAVAHTDFGGLGGQTTNVQVEVTDDDCPPTSQYNAYYSPIGSGFAQLLASGLSEPYLELPNTPQGAGHGEYWFGEFDPELGQVVSLSPRAVNNSQNSTNGSGGLPGASSWRTEYIHSDHLGSTRLVTDEMGQFIAEYKHYPFGHEAQIDGVSDVRMKFTGHERDSELGLDYMLARYCSSNLAKFLSPDGSGLDVLRADPTSWNAYSYVRNSPIVASDPTGLYGQDVHSGWTFALARQAGFSVAEARQIARSNQRMDRGWTSAANLLRLEHNQTQYHGFDADQAEARNAALGANDLRSLGRALHHFADTYSHRGFHPPRGHLGMDPSPDLTSEDVALAMEMLVEKFAILEDAASVLPLTPGEQRGPSFGLPDRNLMQIFLQYNANITDYDPGTSTWDVEFRGAEIDDFVAACQAAGYTVFVDGVEQ